MLIIEELGLIQHSRLPKKERWVIALCPKCNKETRIRKAAAARNKHCKKCSREIVGAKVAKHNHNKKGKKSLTYSTWNKMRDRCNNPNNNNFKYYGGRGISVDPEWNSFNQFLKDMGERPSKEYSLDRIDYNGNYCKENCRWTLSSIQAKNKRSTLLITMMGEELCLLDWCVKLGKDYKLINGRIQKSRWPIHKALELDESIEITTKNIKQPLSKEEIIERNNRRREVARIGGLASKAVGAQSMGGKAAAALGICILNGLKVAKPILVIDMETGECKEFRSSSNLSIELGIKTGSTIRRYVKSGRLLYGRYKIERTKND